MVVQTFVYKNVFLDWLIATLLNIWSAISFHDERGWNQENSLASYQYKDKRWLVEG